MLVIKAMYSSAHPHSLEVKRAFAVLLNLLTLGVVVGVDRIMFPPHQHRTNFTSHAQWSEGPPDALWDMESISDFLDQRGLALQVKLFDQRKWAVEQLGNVRGQTVVLGHVPQNIAVRSPCLQCGNTAAGHGGITNKMPTLAARVARLLQVSNPEAFHERTMECSLQWAARDIGDAAHIIRQHLFEKLAALPVSHRGYKLLLVLPDISWALATPPSELYR